MASEIKNFCFHSDIHKTPFRQCTRRNLTQTLSKSLAILLSFVLKEVLEARSIKILKKECFLVSSNNSKTYFVGIPIDKRIFMVRKSRNVIFNKNKIFYRN